MVLEEGTMIEVPRKNDYGEPVWVMGRVSFTTKGSLKFTLMVVSLFGGGVSVNVSGSSWCKVTVSSKSINALFGEDVCLFPSFMTISFFPSFFLLLGLGRKPDF